MTWNHYICICGTNSQCDKITCGVRQASVLGPLLFLSYVNNIVSNLRNTSIKLFANDTDMIIFNHIVKVLQDNAIDKILLVNSWFVANNLSPSLHKTCYTVFSASEADKEKTNLKIENVIIDNVYCTKYLGIFSAYSLS